MDRTLQGSWSATRWHHTSLQDPGRSLCVICDLGGSVTLSLGDEAWVLTCKWGTRGVIHEGGRFRLNGDCLELEGDNTLTDECLRWRVVDDTLTLNAEPSRCDFDGNGTTEPSALVAVLVRL